jgi:uncharacterized CHY-type Zn-finger protein
MNEQVALLRMKDMEYECINSTIHYYTDKDIPTFMMAQNALKKQIAKKPIEIDEREKDDFYYLSFICGSCLESVFGQSYRPSYCKHCGQKIDWSDENAM